MLPDEAQLTWHSAFRSEAGGGSGIRIGSSATIGGLTNCCRPGHSTRQIRGSLWLGWFGWRSERFLRPGEPDRISVGRRIDLTGESALLTTAEVAVAFAGFASVVTAFRRREHESWAPQDALRFQLMIASSLSVVLFALLPFAIGFLGASESSVWASASCVLGLYLALSLALVARRTSSLTARAALNRHIAWAFVVGGLITLSLQVMNASGVVFERELGPYFLGLLYLLVLAGVSFARMLPIRVRMEGE